MLSVNTYPQLYLDECRAKIAEQVAAWKALQSAAKAAPWLAAVSVLEPHFFNNLLLVLDGHFVHRTRALEKKDGNPLNEVRMLSNSLMNHRNVLAADKTIKYDAARSVLKIRIGEEIKLTEAAFLQLSAAFLTEIETKYR